MAKTSSKKPKYGTGFYTGGNKEVKTQDYQKVHDKKITIDAPTRRGSLKKGTRIGTHPSVDNTGKLTHQTIEKPTNLSWINKVYTKVKWMEKYAVGKWILHNPLMAGNLLGATLIGLGIYNLLTREGTGNIARSKLKDALTMEEMKKKSDIESYWTSHVEKQIEEDLKQFKHQNRIQTIQYNGGITEEQSSNETFDPRKHIKIGEQF